MSSVELATAYVQIVPSAKGIQGNIEKELGGQDAQAGGEKSGRNVSGAFVKGATVVAVAGAAAMTKSFFDAASFEKGMNEVFTLMPGISGEAMGEMTQQVKDFAVEFAVLPNEVIPALYQSISAGVPTDNVFEFLATAQMAAKGGVTELETAVDGISSVVNAYGSDVLSASEASDLMFTAVKLGKTDFNQLSSSLFNVIPTAASLGVGFGDITAAIASLTAQGTPTKVATTQMRQLLVELSKDGSKTSDMFQELSGQTFAEFIAGGGNMADALEILSEAAGPGIQSVVAELNDETSDLAKTFRDEAGVSLEEFLAQGNDLTDALELIAEEAGYSGSSIADMFGSVEAANAALGLTGNIEGYRENLVEMGSSVGATQEAFEQMNQGSSQAMDQLKANLAVTFLNIGETLAPAIDKVLGYLNDLVEMFASLPAPVQTALVGIATGGAALIAGAAAFSKMATAGKGLAVVFKLLAANPWMLVLAGIVALAVLIFKNWDKIADFLKETWEWIGSIAEKVWNAISSFFTGWWEKLEDTFFGKIIQLFGFIIENWDEIAAATSEIWNGILAYFTGIWDNLKQTFFDAVYSVRDTVVAAFTTVRDVLSDIWDTITSSIGSAIDNITGFIQGLIDTGQNIISFFTDLPGKVYDAFISMKDKIRDAIDAIIDFLRRLKDEALDALGPVGKVAGFALEAGGKVIGGVGNLIGFDDGGVVPGPKGSPRLVLAHGGETILPTHKMSISDMSSVQPVASSAAGQNVTVHFDRDVVIRDERDIRELAREIGRETNRAKRAAGVVVAL